MRFDKAYYVSQEMERRIKEGVYKEDRPLPPIRSLAKEFGVGTGVINRAMKDLVSLGFVIGLRGSGYRINKLFEDEESTPESEKQKLLRADPIASKIQQEIAIGAFSSQSLLPSANETADRLGYKPQAVSDAYVLLEERGYLTPQNSRGERRVHNPESSDWMDFVPPAEPAGKRFRYALTQLIEMGALLPHEGLPASSDFAKITGMPGKYVTKVFKRMEQDGFVTITPDLSGTSRSPRNVIEVGERRRWGTQAGRLASRIEWEILQGKRQGSSVLPAPAELAAKHELPLHVVTRAYEMLREDELITSDNEEDDWKVSPQKRIRRIFVERALRSQLSRMKPGDELPPAESAGKRFQDALTQLIEMGALLPRDELPELPELAQVAGISPKVAGRVIDQMASHGLVTISLDLSGTSGSLPPRKVIEVGEHRRWGTQAGRLASQIEWEIFQGKRQGSSALPAPPELAAKRNLPLDVVTEAYGILRKGELIRSNSKDGSWKVSHPKRICHVLTERELRLQVARMNPEDKLPTRVFLAEMLKVDPNIISFTLRKISELQIVPYKGTYVRNLDHSGANTRGEVATRHALADGASIGSRTRSRSRRRPPAL